MNVTYLIGHRNGVPERIDNLTLILKWLQIHFDFDVIVIEQDRKPQVHNLVEGMGFRYQFIYNAGLYNRSWAFNVGYRLVSSDVIICSDNDIVMPAHCIKESLTALEDQEAVSPYKNLYYLPRQKTAIFAKSMQFSRSLRSIIPDKPYSFAGGVVLLKTATFEKIGGWDERFRGWGREDNAMEQKMAYLGIHRIVMPFQGYHLYHSRKQDQKTHTNSQKNLDYLEEYSHLDDEKMAWLITTFQHDGGDIHKYRSES
jgi:GT2 family glycosyltransferase